MNDAILKLNAVGKRFPGVVALRDVSLEVRRGDVHVLLGENGAGKSTLINLLAGIYVPDEGEIVFDGKPYQPRTPIDAYGVGIRVVHQELSMLSQLTVAENLLFESLPRRHGLVNFREMNRRAAELLQEVGLDIAPNTQVSRLGVAQMQLIEIAKALCYDSKLIILDEPTATLTSKEVERLFEILKKLKSKGVTILYISHRLQEIYEIGDAVTVLRDGQVVETRPLAGLTIPDIVRLMVGRSVREEDAYREDVAIDGELLRVEGLQRNASAPAVSFCRAAGRSRRGRGPGGQRPHRDHARAVRRRPQDRRQGLRRRRAGGDPVAARRGSARAEPDDRGSQRAGAASHLALRREHHDHRHGEDFARRIAATRGRAAGGQRIGDRPADQDALRLSAGRQFFRRQSAEGRHRQVAVPRLEDPDLRRADARHRRRREAGDLRPACGRSPPAAKA